MRRPSLDFTTSSTPRQMPYRVMRALPPGCHQWPVLKLRNSWPLVRFRCQERRCSPEGPRNTPPDPHRPARVVWILFDSLLKIVPPFIQGFGCAFDERGTHKQ